MFRQKQLHVYDALSIGQDVVLKTEQGTHEIVKIGSKGKDNMM